MLGFFLVMANMNLLVNYSYIRLPLQNMSLVKASQCRCRVADIWFEVFMIVFRSDYLFLKLDF